MDEVRPQDPGLPTHRRGIYANLDAPMRLLLQRYSAGINAYLERAPAALPLEFSLVRHERPGPWGPVDSLSCTCSIPGP
ncbi:penicillin acylase family protein [Pseudomonas aeruginosa]|nr:penicillin acylase family protein [Pseudomonas aeruginosa]